MYWTKCYRALPRTPTTRQEVLGKLYLPWRIWTDYYQNKLFWRRIRSKKKREPHEERNRLGIIILIYYLRAKSVFLLSCQLWLWYYQGSLIWSHHWIFWVQSCFWGDFFLLHFPYKMFGCPSWTRVFIRLSVGIRYFYLSTQLLVVRW